MFHGNIMLYGIGSSFLFKEWSGSTPYTAKLGSVGIQQRSRVNLKVVRTQT